MSEVNFFFDRSPIQIVGAETGKVYAEGPESDCFRTLKEQYPLANLNEGIYPERLNVIRLKD
ncbi:hypothetical protein ACFQ4N_09425 [Oceanobacillus iheyensis]|uniref:hypothetical protein n=1 Tax=Oceanobacillus iheyensis TaxID=182710 RepID=UPI00363C934D